MRITLADLARRCGAQLRGAGQLEIVGVAALDRAGPDQISYVSSRKHLRQLKMSRAGAVILSQADAVAYDGNALITEHPQLCFARVADLLHRADKVSPGVHPTAVVDPAARIAATAAIGPQAIVEAGAVIDAEVEVGPGCYIGPNAEIGAGTRLVGHAWIGRRTVVGRNCLLQPGVVIGGDGFGFAKEGERWVKIPQLGRVVLGNDVEIGANSTIDCGALNDTEIGDGVKIDNLVQVAHNVRIGAHTAIAGCVGIAGSATIGSRCTLGGQVGVAGHLSIADDVHLLGTSLVASSITEAGTYSSAMPAERVESWRRQVVRLRRLEDMAQRLRQLEQQVRDLKGESS